MSTEAALIEVIKPGLATSVQDRGRQGYYHLGIPPSGALDQYALAAANLLLGNPEDAAVLECTLLGPELLFHRQALIAVTGAAMVPKIDGVAAACNVVLQVPAGARLSFDFVQAGARACLAVAGGIDVPQVLGSRSTYALGAIGGLDGRRLAAGDRLHGGTPRPGARVGRALPEPLQVACSKTQTLRVVPGLYDHRLEPDSVEAFYEDAWVVTSEADRIGYRYKKGRPLRFQDREQPFGAGADPSNIVDACYPIGSIQVPAGIEPIILHRDAVSGGGYAMIGTVISADMDKVGQMQPNQTARFERVTLAQALQARRDYRARFERLREALAS
ncbi:5-oxoprolinase subunit C family protein [Bordetella avium]|uniref:Urea amidolyase-related protein n=1 Tax=Bordetella avium (strain 197N) TaxID=360910 RepID=Q2KTV3_BORA1|nr:biotin-dependent carboxyltransferase family protein [Bordetella avium]AZY50618.1 allophanate hydrolase [Bordetella avium]AZY54015.1 allophanate hydrolase [Bordetella avium]RIQ15213.1 biotin-dependent carboxyltransferase [Bordetella avium]RIQ19982.1 biotin-dependent carboxyltransferase [Bordetella avium]RIQ34562.1 biotin-dependent carboxyltransferase [Bordetella avium]